MKHLPVYNSPPILVPCTLGTKIPHGQRERQGLKNSKLSKRCFALFVMTMNIVHGIVTHIMSSICMSIKTVSTSLEVYCLFIFVNNAAIQQLPLVWFGLRQ